MIVLPTISQKRYTIDSTKYVCYTPIENRSIALVMIKGERDSALYIHCDSDYNKQVNNFISLNKEFNKCDTVLKGCIKDNDNLNVINENLKLKIKKYTYIGIGSLSLNILLILLLLR